MSRLVLILRQPQLKDLYQFWLGLCQDERLPMAADLDPADLRPWIDNLVVLDVSVDGGDFVYAYYGRSFSNAFGADTVGKPVSNLPPEQAATLKAEYDRVVKDHLPQARVYTAEFDGEEQTWERLVLPLFDRSGDVEKLLVCAYRLMN
ncbi:MAG: PAS domain-containing protein [Rhodospirillaceae bacterium]